MTKKRPCKNLDLLNLELWKDFFAKKVKLCEKELWQAPNNNYESKKLSFVIIASSVKPVKIQRYTTHKSLSPAAQSAPLSPTSPVNWLSS